MRSQNALVISDGITAEMCVPDPSTGPVAGSRTLPPPRAHQIQIDTSGSPPSLSTDTALYFSLQYRSGDLFGKAATS